VPLTCENSGALVPGGPPARAIEEERNDMKAQQPTAQPETLKVKVLRAFYYKGTPVEKDAIVELPRIFALEMRDAKKAAVIVEEEKPAGPPAAPAKADKADAGKEKR
jgi:hypothetical protein